MAIVNRKGRKYFNVKISLLFTYFTVDDDYDDVERERDESLSF